MAWIESHQNIKEHPKTYTLMAELGCSKRDAIAIVHMIWWWCLDNALEGHIRVPNIALKAATEWETDADILVNSLLASGWLERHPEGGLLVHDWTHYCGPLVEKRLERKKFREKKAASVRLPNKSRAGNKSRPTVSVSQSVSVSQPKTRELAPNTGAVVVPEILQPETPIQILVRGWKIQSGVSPDDKAWDKVHFARNAAPAKKLLELFAGDVDAALDCIEVVHKQLVGKNGLSLSLEGVVKNSDRFRQEWLERKSQFEGRESSGLLR